MTRFATRRRLASTFALALAAGVLAAPLAANAQAWPSKPITLIVPSTAGGAIDNYARTVADPLARLLKQPVIVDNRGGGGVIGTEAAARAPADGHTLFVGTAAVLTINPSAYRRLPYSVDDFEYICKGVEFPLVLVANPAIGVKDVAALSRWLKAHPDQTSYASYQPGTPSHFLGHQLGEKLGIELTHIPYRGSAPQVTDLIGGTVQFGFSQLATSLPHIRDGRLIALAVTGAERIEQLPNVPTLAEQGLGDLTTSAWFGLLAPKGTPKEVIDTLIQANKTISQMPEVRAAFARQGNVPGRACAAQFKQEVLAEGVRWAKVVKATGFSASE